MPAPRNVTEVRRGAIYPSHADLKKVIARLRRDLKAKPRLLAEFKWNPRPLLGALGLNGDVQNELLSDMGLEAAKSRCIVTCWFTDCVFSGSILLDVNL